jgi:medium-chain acyl-[acyl-carrier-protein] hydrolase
VTDLCSPWIVRPKVAGCKPDVRLFCFPYAGGGASAFRGWADLVPPGIEICAIQLPGREERLKEAPLRALLPLTEQIAQATASLRDRPFAFFGHSMGGLVAFELARLLRQRREPLPRHLVVSGSGAPQLRDAEPRLSELSDPELVARLRRFEGTPEAVLESPELLELVLPSLRADFALRDDYVYDPQPPLAVPITVFGGEDDPDVGLAALGGWCALTEKRFHLRRFPGGHFYLRSQRAELLAAIVAQVRRADDNLSPTTSLPTDARRDGAQHVV